MRKDKKKIYNHLFEYQKQFGGYTGKDLDETARIFGLNKRTLKRNVEKWSKTDPLFSKLKYIGQRSIPITLEEITLLNEAPNRSRAAGYLMTPCSTEVAVGMPCPSRSRAAGYND